MILNRPRVIPCLLIRDEGLVKTIGFKKEIYLGDPINAVRIFNELGIDELCIQDIGAARTREKPNMAFLKKLASEAFMPLSYGGGISNIDEMAEIFRCGFEKVIVNTLLYEKPSLIKEASMKFGSQSIVASIDYKRTLFGGMLAQYKGGTENSGHKPEEMVVKAVNMGAGEILLTSIDNDGKMQGYDCETIRKCAESVSVPVIANGGCGNIEDIAEVLEEGHADAVAAGSFFVFYGKQRAVLIHAPTEEDLIKRNIYKITKTAQPGML